MDFVPYIEKSRDYYAREGYARPYRWAHNTEGPFTPLAKPLSQCRVMLASTASIVLLDDAGQPTETMPVMGGRDLEVFPVPSDLPLVRLLCTSEDHDRVQTDMSDFNAFFPLERLREFVAEGVLGSLAAEALRLVPNYSQRKTLTVDAPEVLRRAREQEVDAVVLSPVWPVCHQTVSLVARYLEENGISTVVFAVARDIVQSAFVPRAVFTNYPLGNPCGRPHDPDNQREILRTGLGLLETATTSGTWVETPYVWSESREWMRLIFSEEQPFLSEEGEAKRQEALERARQAVRDRRAAAEAAEAAATARAGSDD